MMKLPRLFSVALALVLLLSTIIGITPIPASVLSHRIDSHGIAQVWVPPGCFKKGGSEVNALSHHVCLTYGYWIDQYDVTNAAFDAFVKAGGYTTDAYWSREGLAWKHIHNINRPGTPLAKSCAGFSSDEDQPRVCVNWYEAQAYANWRTMTGQDGILYRLPTEAEWEYAARGPLGWIYPWGNVFDMRKANTHEAGLQKTLPVGSYPAGRSWVGAQDMAGNVWQWLLDWEDNANFYQNVAELDPNGPIYGGAEMLRGGSWNDDRYSALSANPYNVVSPDSRTSTIGFRVVGVAPYGELGMVDRLMTQ